MFECQLHREGLSSSLSLCLPYVTNSVSEIVCIQLYANHVDSYYYSLAWNVFLLDILFDAVDIVLR